MVWTGFAPVFIFNWVSSVNPFYGCTYLQCCFLCNEVWLLEPNPGSMPRQLGCVHEVVKV